MAAQYSNRQFFRKTPNLYLAKFFEAKGIQLDVNVSQLKEQDSDTLQSAFNKLFPNQITNIEAEFQDVNALACEGGILALVDEASFHNDDAFIEEIAAIDGFHAKAIWAFLNKPSYWRGAAMFLHADNISASYWKKRNDFLNLPPQLEDCDTDALATAISSYFSCREGRGKNCIVESYRRNQKEYLFAYPEDFAQTAIEWVEGALKNQAHHPAFEIIFVYCEAEGSLDIYAPKNGKAVPDLQELFAKHILKLDGLSEWQKDRRVYELNPVLENGFEFKIEPTSGITSVLVTSLRVTLKGDRKKRIVVEADPYKDNRSVHSLLERLNLSPYDVTQLSLKVTFEPVGGAKAKSRRVNITYPNSCALNHDGNDLKIRQMLVLSGLEPKAVTA
ncbi:hypothetical protein TUM19329_02620 [Legionella antarctica]|uniref:Uncharacterized protein n=1 Tax=Legionella antarctica TaxID=2708020 RepID=A0A6F8T0B4_9GAMM|nr:hypothetical protein [Legionella antarctica]BCA93901.1 hypothetical protein TUM19329_02620 [Legionella antarctica]